MRQEASYMAAKEQLTAMEMIWGFMSGTTGHMAEKKASLTGSVAVVKMKEVADIPTGNVMSGLQGRVAGMNVTTDGKPGGGNTDTKLRGITTINNSSPLYVIDGVQTHDNVASIISSNDVESIQVLKDAASAAIYGAQAANGVIIITTKRAKEGDVKVSFDMSLTAQTFTGGIDMLDAYQWGDVYWQAYKNTFGTNPNSVVYGNGDIKEIKVNKDKKSQECDREYYYDDYIGLIYARAYNDEHEYEMYYTYDDILIRYIKNGDSYDYKKIPENKWSYFTLEEGKDLYEMYHDDYDEDSDDYSYNDEDDYSSTDYILLNSDERYIDKSELSSLGQWQLRLARNEIYARYGYSFEDEELRRYFLNKSWYEEDSSINKDTWSDDCLNEYEKANRNLIVSYEEEMGYR